MTFLLESARTSFELLLSIGAGSGLLYLLRWYWWRINAWSEIAAMAVSFVVGVGFFVAGKTGNAVAPNTALLVTVFATTVAWIAVTLATRPENEATLVRFYQLVRPAGPRLGPDPRQGRRRRIARQHFAAAARLGARLHVRLLDAVRRRQRAVWKHVAGAWCSAWCGSSAASA